MALLVFLWVLPIVHAIGIPSPGPAGGTIGAANPLEGAEAPGAFEIAIPGPSTLQLRISFPQADVVRMSVGPASHPLPLHGESVDAVLRERDGRTSIQTSALRLDLRHEPFAWDLYTRSGRWITGGGDPAFSWTPDASWTSAWMPAYETDLGRASLRVDAADHFFGLGQKFDTVDHAGRTYRSWICDCAQDGSYPEKGDGYYSVPFLWTARGWGLFVHSTADVEWDVADTRRDQVAVTDASGSPLDLYLMAPGTPREVFDRFTDIIGKPNLPPKWSFEQWVDGVYGSADNPAIKGGEAAMRDYLGHFERNRIPVRNLVVEDWTTLWWMGARWEWNPSMFPDPQGFVQDLKDDGYRVMLWETPAIGVANDEWPEAAALGYFAKDENGAPYVVTPQNSGSATWWMQGVSIVDFTNPAALEWWRLKHEPLVGLGIDGYKADGGEEPTPDMVFHNGERGITMHNRNAALYNQALLAGIEAAHGEGAIEGRSGGLGSHQASGIWNGDQGTGFGWLQRNLAAGLSASNSGLYWWTFDQGGLSGVLGREEMLRNLEANVFSPWFKMHLTWDHPRAPWDYDAAALDTYRYYSEARLALLDYLYGEAEKSAATGVPLTRILAVDFPSDPGSLTPWTQFLVGDQLLVAPLVFEGETTQDIHLPPGDWTDLLTGDTHRGPVDLLDYSTPPELLPMFWKEGGEFPRPDLGTHPGLPEGWTPTFEVRRAASRAADLPDEVQLASGSITGPVVAWQSAGPNGATFEFNLEGAPLGDGWLRVRWNSGPSVAYLQENFLNVELRDAAGALVPCGGGSVIVCRIHDWSAPGTWTLFVRAWTGHDIEWDATLRIPR